MGPLKRIVVGRPNGSAIAAPEPGWMYNCAGGGVGLGYPIITRKKILMTPLSNRTTL